MRILSVRHGTLCGLALIAAGCYYGSTTETPNPSLASETAADTVNPPDQAGRISYIDGAVSFRPAEADTWAFAELNRTVTTGDRMWVDTVGHAEIEVGANAVRVGPETEVDAVHIDGDMLQLRVPQGMVNLRIRSFKDGGDYEIDAPNAAVSATQAGDYRVDVSADGDTTRVTVHTGQLQVTSAGRTFQVDAQQMATVRGDSSTTYDIGPAPGPDAFDDWTLSRDARDDRASASARYASPDMGGLADLDDNGSWTDNPDYGPVWFPSGVAVGWAPYSFGQWVWIDPWGWTWVDNEPWGWAPFHYGRWAYVGGAWGWCPGAGIYEPIYGPGFTAFLGGPGWTFGVGWFPLGPGDPWWPPYRSDFVYRQRINVRNYTNVSEVRGPVPAGYNYRNRAIPGAVSAVPEQRFAGGSPLVGAVQHPGPTEVGGAHVIGTTPGVAPTRASLGLGPTVGGRSAAAPPRTVQARPVVALHAPPPAAVPFSAEEHAIAANGGRPLSNADRTTLARTAGTSAQRPAFRSAVSQSGRSLSPARPGLAPARPANEALFNRNAGAIGSTGRSSLDDSYRDERSQLEQRHVQEFANPRSGESQEDMMGRQQLEHNDIQQRYNMARSSGMSRMPASHFSGGGGFHGGGGRPR
jgi:hypothetical protein